MSLHPLVVDLDGTLIRTDMLHESALRLLRDDPLRTLYIPCWLSRGKAALKQRLADCVGFKPESLPYDDAFLDWLKLQRSEGRPLILCTASDRAIATAISEHLGVFDEVMASDGATNLAGARKADALESRFGRAGFDYAGNSRADLAVWRRARRAVVVNATPTVLKQAGDCCEVEQVFAAPASGWPAWRRVLRVHQWLKNLLVFVPLFAAHRLGDSALWSALALAFVAFSLCASSVYIVNDLLDLDSDRQHPRKRLRPFASGQVPAWKGVALAPLLLFASIALAWHVSPAFMAWLLAYFVLTCAYTLALKRVALLDCLALAALYTLRVIAGAAAADMVLSFWLLAFSGFVFLSLAFVKRYAELEVHVLGGRDMAPGRGYFTTDAPMVQALGIASGYAAVLVFALYVNSDAVRALYHSPEIVWGGVPVLLFWVSWMWMQAHRGHMHDDPLVFALRDKASVLAGAAFAAVLGVGTVGWPW